MSKAVQSSLAMVPVKVVLFGQIAPLEKATPIHIPPLNDRACFYIFFHTLTILGHYHVFNLYQLAKQKITSLCCCNLHLFEDCCRLNTSSKCISPLCLSFGVVRSCLQSVFRPSAHLMNLQERSENSKRYNLLLQRFLPVICFWHFKIHGWPPFPLFLPSSFVPREFAHQCTV